MSENEEEQSENEPDENQFGVILGFWDHEKTPILIQDLEHSVNSVEEKCKKLLEELIYYKKFLEESYTRQSCRPKGLKSYRINRKRLDVMLKEIQMTNLCKSQTARRQSVLFVQTSHSLLQGKKNSQNSRLLCGSDPDISFRKKLMSNLQMAQVFEQKFQEKLHNINRELTEAANKIGLKDNIVLFPTEDYLKTIQLETQEHIDKTWSDICQEFLKMNYFRSKTKSDTMVRKSTSEECAQITKQELKLYQKLSKLSMRKKKRRKGKEAKKVKFTCMKKLSSRLEEACRKISKEKKKRKKRKRKYVSREEKSRLSQTSDIQVMCKTLTEAIQKKSVEKPKEEQEGQGSKVSLGSVVRKVVPFTTCKSTSRSYNLGVNVQQFLSQTKYEKAKTWENRKQSSGGGERGQTGWRSQNTYQGRDDVWISEHHTSANIRKVRSRYTGRAPEGYVEYHKSQTMSQYTNGQKSMIKSESKTAYAIGSKIVMSDCRRTDYYQIDKDGRYYASGDGVCKGSCDKINMDWSKVYGAFLDVYKRYTELKRNIVDNECELQDSEIELLENEIDQAINKYKDFLQFYSKFLQLKHRLKSLKFACETKIFEPVTSFPSNFVRKMIPFKPTYSMAMRKALREIQNLQEKIRLIRDV